MTGHEAARVEAGAVQSGVTAKSGRLSHLVNFVVKP